MAKYRKKPVVIDAEQFLDSSHSLLKIDELMGAEQDIDLTGGEKKLHIVTREGTMTAKINDWIIKGVNGEFYPCGPDIFNKTYEPA